MIRKLIAFADTLPGWLRPSFWGAIIVLALVATRLLLLLPFAARSTSPHVLELLLALAAAAAAGATGGLAWSLVGRHVEDWPYVGPYLAGIVAVGGYVWPLLLAIQFIDPGYLPLSRMNVLISCIVTVFFGSVFGWSAFRR